MTDEKTQKTPKDITSVRLDIRCLASLTLTRALEFESCSYVFLVGEFGCLCGLTRRPMHTNLLRYLMVKLKLFFMFLVN